MGGSAKGRGLGAYADTVVLPDVQVCGTTEHPFGWITARTAFAVLELNIRSVVSRHGRPVTSVAGRCSIP